MIRDSRWCMDCHAVRALNQTGRCDVCKSDAVTTAAPPKQAVTTAAPPRQPKGGSDGTVRLLVKWGIPVTRENYLMLAFAGHPPEEPLDGEIELMIPREVLAADKRAIRRADRKWLREIGVSR